MGTDNLKKILDLNSAITNPKVNGGGKRDRTDDLLHAMQALSQLSYTPIDSKPNTSLADRFCGTPFQCVVLRLLLFK